MRLLLLIILLLFQFKLFGQNPNDTIKIHFVINDIKPKKLKVKFKGIEDGIIDLKKETFKDRNSNHPNKVIFRLIVTAKTNKVASKIKYGKIKIHNGFNYNLSYRRKENWIHLNNNYKNISYSNSTPSLYNQNKTWIGINPNRKLAINSTDHSANKSTISWLTENNLSLDSVIVFNSGWSSRDSNGNITTDDNSYVFLVSKKSKEEFKTSDPAIEKVRNSNLFHSSGPIIESEYYLDIITNQITIHWINPNKNKDKLLEKYEIKIGTNAFETTSSCCGYSYQVTLSKSYGNKTIELINNMNKSGNFIASFVPMPVNKKDIIIIEKTER